MRASVQVWAKGYALKGRSPEFDIVVPPNREGLGGVECRLGDFNAWGELVEAFYKLGDASMDRQFIVLFETSEFAVATASPSVDHVGRPSVVLVSAAVSRIDWRDSELPELVARSHGLCLRLARSYGESLAGAPALIAEQLESGRFLPDRSFNLQHETPPSRTNWSAIVSEVKRWRGITGLGTPALASLGANVVYGTRDEIQRTEIEAVDALFDVARGRIERLTDDLQLWAPSGSEAEAETAIADEAEVPIDPAKIEEIGGTAGKALDVLIDIRDLLRDVIERGRGKGKKRRR